MSKEPKIVHACNHMVASKVKKYGGISMVRGNSPNRHDAIPRNMKVTRVDSVKSKDGKTFKKGYHYNQSISQDIIEWTNSPGTPAFNEEYTVYAAYVHTSSIKYNAMECVRCNGNGWYISIVNTDSQIEFIEGSQKLIQAFIKYMNTEYNGKYGSTIKELLGNNVYSELDVNNAISSTIDDCQQYLKAKQNEELQNGSSISDDELLDKLEVRQIYFVREETAYVISVVIHNMAGRAIRFNFKV